MDNFITEHGGIIVSGIVSVATLVIMFLVMMAVSNMDAYSMSAIMGV